MRRYIATAAVALFIAVSPVIAKPPTPGGVTNPLNADLDANGHDILNVRSLTATGNISAQSNIQTSGYFVGRQMVAMDGTMILEPPDTSVIAITSGRQDPTATCPVVNPGALYLQGAPTAGLWLMTGPGACDWQRIAP